MTIGIDITPTKSNHRFRGTGSYTENLTKSLKKYALQNEYKFFTHGETLLGGSQVLPHNVDLIHYPYFDPFFLTLPLRKPVPIIVTIHDLIPLVFPSHFPCGLRGRIKWQIQKWSLKGVAAVITDSYCSKKDVVRLAGMNEEKIFVVHLATGEEFRLLNNKKKLEGVKIKYRLPEKFVLYVGDVTWNKNVPGLVKAIQKINAPLVLVGKQLANSNFDRSNPWNKDLLEVERLAKGDKKVFRLGFVSQDDLVAIYNLATVCAQPSFYEGFGLPILEAMTCGCPVVTSKVSSLPEVAGEAAFYVDPNSIDEVAGGIGKIYFNPQTREKFSQKGLLQAEKFSWKKTAKEITAVYKQALTT